MSFQEELEKILAKTPCIDSDCGGQGGTWQGDPENPEPVQCQYCDQERYPFIDQALTSIINLVDKKVIGEDEKPFKLPPNTGMLLDSKMLGRNELRAEQRAKLKGVSK